MTASQQGLKLIAIKPLEGCNPKYLKILQADTIYPICSDYAVTTLPGGREKITITDSVVPDIYSFNGVKISVSAIVGKNGTGKSTLMELFFAAIYNISKAADLIRGGDEKGEPFGRVFDINVSIYFSIDDAIFKIKLVGKKNRLYTYDFSIEDFINERYIQNKKDLEQLFYTICINYSHFALNSAEIDPWVEAIFSKNDAYQTPLVINPYRKKGNIDVNSENYLVRSRLLANILEGTTSVLSFTTGDKIPKSLTFELDPSKFNIQKKTNKIAFKFTHNQEKRVFPELFEVFFGNRDLKIENSELNKYAKEYILTKLKNIVSNYNHYNEFRGYAVSSRAKRLVKYLQALKDDESHVTFKLKQAINFLVFDIYPKGSLKFSLNVEDLQPVFKNKERTSFKFRNDFDVGKIPVIELIPPSFLKMDMEFSEGDHKFSQFSSGEKQKIYTSASLIYHLKNLESVLKNESKLDQPFKRLVRYKHVNVIFDEIELYYHPDLQRRFLKDMLSNLANSEIKLIKSINFIFVTHSPFILSDISNKRILYLDLKDGKAMPQDVPDATFGANIHDLLAKSFFLEKEGYMGEFAKSKIKEIHWHLQNFDSAAIDLPDWREHVRAFIDMIGEPLIYNSMNGLYTKAFLRKRSKIDEEIERLLKLKKEAEE